MKKINKALLLVAPLSILAIAPMSISCKKDPEKPTPTPDPAYESAKQVLDLKKAYEDELAKDKLAGLSAPTKEQSEKIVQLLNKYIAEIDKVDKTKLSADGLAWLVGIRYNWEIEKGNHEKGLRYLLASFHWGVGSTYVANSFYGSIELKAGQNAKAKVWLANLKEAIQEKIVPSKVFIKENVRYVIQNVYAKELKAFAEGTESEIKVVDLISKNTADNMKDINEFYKFYATTYYNASEYGKGEDYPELKISKTNTGNLEKENHLVIGGQKLYGLGMTNKDLNQTEVGIGYIPGKPGGLTGKEIYEQISKTNTTSELTPQEVFKKGYDSTKSAAENMKKVAVEVAKLIAGETGEWKPTFKYDDDGIGGNEAADITLTIRQADGTIDLDAFNKWLNAEEFFFGREANTYYSDQVKKSLNEDKKLKDARGYLTQFGYDHLKGDTTKYGSITNDQFYYGALEAFKAYHQFKDTTQKYGASFFGKEVPDYGIQTYNFSERAYEGVGAYSSDVKNFMFNCDPYYGLPKWSVTSFANHESMMGHHNQLMYAERYLAKIKELSLGADTFDYNSYVEGWALFMEWFGIENGLYGTPDYENSNYYALPKDFSLSKGITNFFTTTDKAKITAEQVKKIQELHGGVYWKQITEADEKEHAIKAVKLANMLQFYGALNEAQLRNMRLAVDSIYHGKDVLGETDFVKGASIKQAREFMKKNSALGLGDITSESKRYFNCVGQAVSYNSGKEVMLDLYKKVHTKLGLTRQQFLEKTTTEDGKTVERGEIKKFLDWLLRNSALPMQALVEAITKAYNL